MSQIARAALEMVETLKIDEVLSRFHHRLATGKVTNRPVTVLDYLGEQRMVALVVLTGGYRLVRFPPMSDQQRLQLGWGLGLAVRRAVPFLWTHEMRLTAASYEVPRHRIGPEAFPHELMWWTFETAVGWPGEAAMTDAFLIARWSLLSREFPDAFGYVDGEDGWMFVEFGSDGGAPDTLWARATMSIPDATDSATLGSHVAVFGMAAFLNSHFVEVRAKRPAETDKRWHGRRVGDPASLNVVTLRSSVREAAAIERGEGPKWKERWLVRGHLRAQWYPSIKSHRIIWIAPYLKGPDDAPLKVPVYRVAR